MENTKLNPLRQRVIQISKETGIPVKKILDFFYALSSGSPIENNKLIQKVGTARNSLDAIKKTFSNLLKPSSRYTELRPELVKEVNNLFQKGYQTEEYLESFLENEGYKKIVDFLEKYKTFYPSPNRRFDQFTATIETTVKRASLLNHFEDIRGKKVLILGDDDFTSVAAGFFKAASEITVLDIDNRITDKINAISYEENLKIITKVYDAQNILPRQFSEKFDVVFTDPPYTEKGITLFLSRSIAALDPLNKGARIYICYGNSERARERFLPIYKLFYESGMMIRWIFDKFNRYQGSESIGSASSLFVCDVTPKTKPIIIGNYYEPIYTNN